MKDSCVMFDVGSVEYRCVGWVLCVECMRILLFYNYLLFSCFFICFLLLIVPMLYFFFPGNARRLL
jgi:hypothetical protein